MLQRIETVQLTAFDTPTFPAFNHRGAQAKGLQGTVFLVAHQLQKPDRSAHPGRAEMQR